ncbi:MAG: 3-keto-5-aminohexanoate cleavage protein, partial [Saprospiraceae bacterium]
EMEVFDNGHINNMQPFIDMGIIKKPMVVSFVMGVLGGIAPTTKNILHQSESVPEGANWQVIGIGRKQWALLAAGLTIGGNIRAGLEDNFYLPSGEMATSNGELIKAATGLSRMLGREPSTIEETRQRLGLPVAVSS